MKPGNKSFLFLSLIFLSSCVGGLYIGNDEEKRNCVEIIDDYNNIKEKSDITEIDKIVLSGLIDRNNKRKNISKEKQDIATKNLSNPKSSKTIDYLVYKLMIGCKNHISSTPHREAFQWYIKLIDEIVSRIRSKYKEEESQLFWKRSKGKGFCNVYNLNEFFSGLNVGKPSKECIYVNNGEFKAVLSTSTGIVADLSYMNPYSTGKYIYISKDNAIDRDVVDGGMIEPGYFEYIGIRQGSISSSYSFRRIDSKNLFKDILFYKGVQ